VTVLQPGILVYEHSSRGEFYLAVDEGVMVKTGYDVLVSVRNAFGGTDLSQLQEAINREFLNLSEQEHDLRSVVAKIETGFLRQMRELNRDR